MNYMSGAELKAMRIALGIGMEDLARRLGREDRKTVLRWEKEYTMIPEEVSEKMRKIYQDWIARIEFTLDAVVEQLEEYDATSADLTLYRSNRSYERALGEDASEIQSWSEHTAFVAMLNARLNGLGIQTRIGYVSEED